MPDSMSCMRQPTICAWEYTQYWVLDGNPSDEDHVVPSIQQHKKHSAVPPSVRQRPRRCHTYETRWMTQKVLYEKRRMYGQKIYLYPLKHHERFILENGRN